MNSQDLVTLSADNEEHKQHKKRTKKIKAQLKDQVTYLYLVDYKTMILITIGHEQYKKKVASLLFSNSSLGSFISPSI